jgi:hypothetical protein
VRAEAPLLLGSYRGDFQFSALVAPAFGAAFQICGGPSAAVQCRPELAPELRTDAVASGCGRDRTAAVERAIETTFELRI